VNLVFCFRHALHNCPLLGVLDIFGTVMLSEQAVVASASIAVARYARVFDVVARRLRGLSRKKRETEDGDATHRALNTLPKVTCSSARDIHQLLRRA